MAHGYAGGKLDGAISGHTACKQLDCKGEKDAKLAQKMGQLQPFITVFSRENMANLHLLGQPDTSLAKGCGEPGARHREAPAPPQHGHD